jgi:hypothetical protein
LALPLADGSADDANVELFKASGVCPGCNLMQANLRRLEIEAAGLSGANLREADLKEVTMPRSNFHGADLRRAEMDRAMVDWDWFDGNDDTFADIEVTDVETEEVVYAIVVFRSTGGDIGGSCCSGSPESPRWPAFIAGAIAFALTRLKRVDEQAAS